MPKTLAEGKKKLVFLSTPPADAGAVTTTELAAGVDLSEVTMSTGYTLGPTGSDTVTEKSIIAKGNSAALGPSNYAASVTFFRYFDAGTGQSEAAADLAWTTFAGKGTHGYLVERDNGKDGTDAWAAGDEYRLFEVTSDDAQNPAEMTGYKKFTQPFAVGDLVELRGVVAAGV